MLIQQPARPSHRAYLVTGEGDARHWRRLGPVWRHPDGDSFIFKPTALPTPGHTITVRSVTYLPAGVVRKQESAI